ncbi:MAG: glycosyltransferase family 4 protein [Candidatus Nomurabacteria bacterium]|nr:MAG: glycosyltransferase family 4 protein [Candidatus Nomurabacteria bacterium]
MKIGIVTQSFFPIRGGVAEHVYHTAHALERRGHEVVIITANFSRFDEDRGCRVERIGRDLTIPFNQAFVNLTISWNIPQELRHLERKYGFDVVHIHGPYEPFLPALALKNIECPKVGTFHAFNAHPSLGYRVFENYIRTFKDRLSARIAVSQAAKDFISHHFPDDYEIIPNGVDVQRFSPQVKPFPWYNPEKFTILFVGRMDPRKGLKYLLRAFTMIASEFPQAEVVVVGNGILRRYYETFLEPSLKDRVRFEGFVSAADLPRYYASSDVYVSPATGNESFGIVLLEGMASGKPVIASDIDGYRDVIRHGQDGILVPKSDPAALAQALRTLARDPQERAKYQQAGRQRAEEFSWESITDRLEEVYRRVVY